MGWLAGASVLVIPVAAVCLAATDRYDGTKIYWEGLVAVPLVSAGVLLAAELESRGVRDSVAGDPALLYLWDILRGRALALIGVVAVYGAGSAWSMASDGLGGVALMQASRPVWVDSAFAATRMLGIVFLACTVFFTVGATSTNARRLRRRLWPDLHQDDKVHWGGAESAPSA